MTKPRMLWPNACLHPNSCAKHQQCMYMGCYHDGEDIKQEIENAVKQETESAE